MKTQALKLVSFLCLNLMIFSGCKKDLDLSHINQECIKFNPDEVHIEGPVWKLVYHDTVLLYFPNQNEAQEALSVIKDNNITEQCKIGDGIYTDSFGQTVYDDGVMYYYLSNGEVPITSDQQQYDYLWVKPNKVHAKKVDGNWTVVQQGELMYSFGNNKEACIDAVKAIHKYEFELNCYIGRPYCSMNFFLKKGTPPSN